MSSLGQRSACLSLSICHKTGTIGFTCRGVCLYLRYLHGAGGDERGTLQSPAGVGLGVPQSLSQSPALETSPPSETPFSALSLPLMLHSHQSPACPHNQPHLQPPLPLHKQGDVALRMLPTPAGIGSVCGTGASSGPLSCPQALFHSASQEPRHFPSSGRLTCQVLNLLFNPSSLPDSSSVWSMVRTGVRLTLEPNRDGAHTAAKRAASGDAAFSQYAGWRLPGCFCLSCSLCSLALRQEWTWGPSPA